MQMQIQSCRGCGVKHWCICNTKTLPVLKCKTFYYLSDDLFLFMWWLFHIAQIKWRGAASYRYLAHFGKPTTEQGDKFPKGDIGSGFPTPHPELTSQWTSWMGLGYKPAILSRSGHCGKRLGSEQDILVQGHSRVLRSTEKHIREHQEHGSAKQCQAALENTMQNHAVLTTVPGSLGMMSGAPGRTPGVLETK